MNEEEALQLVHTALKKGLTAHAETGGAVTSGELEQCTEQLLAVWKRETVAAHSPGSHEAFLGFHYVIPDQDLKLVETVAAVLTTAGGAGFLLPALGSDTTKGIAAVVTGVIVALLKLFQNLKLSVHLGDTDYAIVVVLSRAKERGLSIEELQERLKPIISGITTETLSKRLEALTACATIKGTKTALAWKEGERWRVNGV